MTLHRLPLGTERHGTQSGEVVNASDMALYNYDNATDQSGVKIALGETLCERTLLARDARSLRPVTTLNCSPP